MWASQQSYHQFAEGYFLRRDAMQWFWDQYTTDPAQRAEITASPLRATVEQLRDLPPALVITGEADVLRDEGEAYAAKLRELGVPAQLRRFSGLFHGFINSIGASPSSRDALVEVAGMTRALLRSR